MIDLRSDTVTLPTNKMLEAMQKAKVGDDVLDNDPTVFALEQKAAKLFGKETGLFCPSGTMTNQIAIKLHTQPGDEVICSDKAHIYNYEGGGIAFNSGASVKVINSTNGLFKAHDVQDSINPINEHFSSSKLVVIENTSNKGGGTIFPTEETEKIQQVCKANNLKLHLDGARIFNAWIEEKFDLIKYGCFFDTISICLSKGLGAPVGSLLLGNKSDIQKAIRIRKVFGGGMRQSGYLAAAGIYALDHHIELLKFDNNRAKQLGEFLKTLGFITKVYEVQTNIVLFKIDTSFISVDHFIEKCKTKGLGVIKMDNTTLRMVTHLGVNDEMLEEAKNILSSF